MSRLTQLTSFVRALLFAGRMERDMAQEWAFHVEQRVDDLVACGLTRGEAERRARQEFGDTLRWREEGREARGLRLLDELRQDVAYALRQMQRAPGFTLIAVLTLALGIGANTAIFSVVNAVLLRPLPYEDADRLVRVWSTMAAAGVPRSPSALPDYREWRARNRTFTEMGAYHGTAYNLTGTERPERLQGTRLTASIWSMLGARPLVGRLFDADSEQWGHHRVVVLSHRLWQRRFASDPAVVGRTITLDGESHVIVGVMPVFFAFPSDETQLWAPVAFAPGDSWDTRSNHFVSVLGPAETRRLDFAGASRFVRHCGADRTYGAGKPRNRHRCPRMARADRR